jgi:hypothetical protein
MIHLTLEQAERLERYRAYLELYWNSPVSPAEALIDVLGLGVKRNRGRR